MKQHFYRAGCSKFWDFRRERERERDGECCVVCVVYQCIFECVLSGLMRYFVDERDIRVIRNIDRRIEFIRNDSAKIRGRDFFLILNTLSCYIQSTTVQQSNEFSYLCKDSTKISGVEEKKKRSVGRFKERRFGSNLRRIPFSLQR